jgi:hypothetical protein
MKRIYSRLRIGMMTFALGLAAVYMADRLPSGPNVELPTAVSTNIFPVFLDKSRIFTREKNCGKDPSDPQARLDCTKESLFENRNMALYARYEITCDSERWDSDKSACGSNDKRMRRSIVWRRWNEKTRAHVIVQYMGDKWNSKSHYFIEPSGNGSWQLSVTYERSMWLFVDGEETEVTRIEPHWSYKQGRWKTSTRDDAPYDLAPGTRYLQFENETGDTVSF